MSPKTIHGIQAQLWEYNKVAWLHQQVFSYRDEVQSLAKSIFIPHENSLTESPFEWYNNWIFSVSSNIWWGWYEAELNRVPGRILPANQKNKAPLIWSTNVWIRRSRNIIWDIWVPGILPINGRWATGLFQFNNLQYYNFSPTWGKLLNVEWKDHHGNILATIDWVQWLVTWDITNIMRVDSPE